MNHWCICKLGIKLPAAAYYKCNVIFQMYQQEHCFQGLETNWAISLSIDINTISEKLCPGPALD